MTQAYILNETLSDADQHAIRELVEARGFDVIFGMPADLPALTGTDAIGVICLPANQADSELLSERARLFTGADLRVIGIWLHNETAELPAALGDLGSAVVAADSPALDQVLKEPTAAIWEHSDGTPRADQPTPRNRC